MLEIRNNKNLTVFFPEDDYVTKQKCNVCCYVGISRLHDERNFYIDYKTLISDISKENPDFFDEFNKVIRYDIRRSYSDDLNFETYSSEQILNSKVLLNSFQEMYTDMYKQKGLTETAPIDSIILYCQYNGVVLTAALSDGQPIVYHAYIVDGKYACLWMSCSVFRNNDDTKVRAVIGRANKRLHYEDMLCLQKQGYQTYDWGGITSFEEPNGIDTFKISFGGKKTKYYYETCIYSLPHKILKKIKDFLHR